MPNATTHFIIGAAAGATVNAVMQFGRMAYEPLLKFNWGEFLICTGAAGTAALLPDILEPADSPNHRAFFHSLAMAVIVSYFITGKHTGKWPIAISLLVGMAGIGYLSHIIADATTPKSIAFI